MNFFERLSNYRNENIISSYVSRINQHFLVSPYNKLTYEDFLLKLKNDNKVKIINFEAALDPKKSNFVFRHDLDTSSCLGNFSSLADLHIRHDIPLSVFVRMDDMDYPYKQSHRFVSEYSERFQVGLHSSCYIHNDPLSALRAEILKFQDIYGHSPKFLTLHGMGEYKYAERMKLVSFLSQNYKDFGFSFADFISTLRTYNYVIQDCHLDNNGNRYIKKDFVNLPPCINGSCYLILAHPCYWEKRCF